MSEYEQEIPQLQITDQLMTLEIRRSGGGQGARTPTWKIPKNTVFSNNDPDPLERYQASIQC